MNTLVIEKQTGGYFKFTLNGDTANAITSIQNDLLAVGTQLHFKTGNGANIIKEQFIYPADVTIIASGTFTFSTVAQVWDKLIDIDYFAWLGGGGTGGVDRFDDLLDTFSYTGNAGKAVVVDGSELRLVPITLYNKRLFTELEDTPSSLVPNKMLVVNPAGTAVVLQDQPEQPEQLLNSVGYFDYNDLITQTTPLNAVANVALKLTNDTEGANTSTDQNPYGVSYVWDYTTNAFNFSELEVGDTIDVRVHVQVTTTSANQRVLLSAKLGIGSVAEFTNIIYENQFKSAGLHEINFVAPFYMRSTYITDNPAELYLTTDSSATVKVDGWYVRILRKNINIITVDYTVPDATTTVKGIVRLAGDLAGTANSPTVPELANKVPNTRTVSTTSPLLGGGALSSNLTLSIQQANSVDSGYLSNVDWSTFNGKANDNAVVKLTGDQSITGSKSFTTNTAAPAMVVTNNSTDNGILLQNTSTGRGVTSNNVSTGIGFYFSNASTGTSIYSVNSSTGKGIHSINSSTGQGIYSENSLGGWGIFSNNASTGRGINSVNSSTGTGFYSTNSSGGTGIESYNSSSGTGFYSNNSSTGNGIESINNSSGYGISSSNTGSGRGIYSSNNSTGDAINIANSGSGRGIYLTNASSGKSLILNNDTAATGMPFTVSKNGTDKFTINDAGEATGIKFIKSGGTSSQFLKADGSVDSSTYALTSQLHDAVTIGTANGLSLSGQVLSLALASPTTRGALTSEDYNYFFDKVQGNGNQNYIPKYIFSGSNKVIGNSQIYDNGTNVGIGTTSPNFKIQSHSTGINNYIQLTSATTGSASSDGLIIGTGDNGAAIFLNRENTNSIFYTNNTERMWITSSGNVLMNSTGTDVGAKLSVDGNIYNNGDFRIGASYGATNTGIIKSNSGVLSLFTWGDSTNIQIGGNDVIFKPEVGTERMRITSDGRVGIGVASVSKTLQVAGESSIASFRLSPAAGTYENYRLDIVTQAADTGAIRMSLNDNTFLKTYGYYFLSGLSLGVAGNEDLLHLNSGNKVGIGTTSPAEKLSVVGGNISLGAGYKLQYSSTAYITPENNVSGAEIATGGILTIKTGGTTERVIVDASGNVGIGTLSPSGKLDVNGTSIIRGTATFQSNVNIVDNNVLNLGSNQGGGATLKYNANGNLDITPRSGFNTIFTTGNVGIGTTSPSTKLDVVGAITASGGFFNSDMRLKDLTDYDYNVSDIKPITYLWKDGRDNKKHVGYSAQEVQKVMPDAVNEGTDGMLSVNYVEILVAKISQMEKEIAYLKSKI